MMEKVYMVCDYTDDKAAAIAGCPNIGVEYMGNCGGRILREDGTEIGRHHSSSFSHGRMDWYRTDTREYINIDNYSYWE